MKASQTHHQKQYCRKGGNHRCGSELARDEAITFTIDDDCYTAIASKLAPTLDCVSSANQSSLTVMFGIAGVAASCNTIRAPTWRASSWYTIAIGLSGSAITVGLPPSACRSEEHTSELQSLRHLVCRLLLEKKKK